MQTTDAPIPVRPIDDLEGALRGLGAAVDELLKVGENLAGAIPFGKEAGSALPPTQPASQNTSPSLRERLERAVRKTDKRRAEIETLTQHLATSL